MNNLNRILVVLLLVLPVIGCSQSPATEHTGQYNLSLVANNSGIVSIMQKTNTELMFGWYGNMILITLGTILFMAFFHSTGEANKSMAATGYILFASAAFMRVLDLVGDYAVFITLIIAAIATASLFIK